MIIINFDFTTGNELSYIEGVNKEKDFETNCLEFFCFDVEDEVKVIKKNGDYILKSELLGDTNPYTEKHIRREHNLRKMLVAGKFEFKKGSK